MVLSAGAILGAAGIGAVGSLGSSAISYIGGNAASKRQYHYARDLANLQYELTQRGYLESPSAQRAGLERAGYNPILAVNNGMSYGSYSATNASPASINAPDVGSNVSNAYRAFKLEREQVEAGVNNTNAQTAFTQEQTKNAVVQRDLMTLDKLSKDLDNQLKKKDLSWYDRVKTQEVQELLTRSKYNVASAVATRMNANASMLNASTNAKIAPSQMSMNQANASYNLRRASGKVDSISTSRSGSVGARGYSSSVTNSRSRTR